MASEISISDDIHVFYEKVYNLGEADAAGKPHLSFAFAYDVDGEMLESVAALRLPIGCGTSNSPSSLQALVRLAEPLPLEIMIDPEDAETARERIAHVVAVLLCDCFEDVGLKSLRVDVVVRVYTSEDEDWTGERVGHIEDVELLQERRMGSVSLYRNAVGGGRVNGGQAEEEKEACVVCLEEMATGEELALTPCVHRFHSACLRRWFEKAGVCPLCRLQICP